MYSFKKKNKKNNKVSVNDIDKELEAKMREYNRIKANIKDFN